MSMAEPVLPHPESPNEPPATGQETSPKDLTDNLPMPDLPSDGRVSADDMNGEAPD